MRYFLEKTPEHALHADFILKCFPTARFIHVIRDARHVVASLIRTAREFGRGPDSMNATLASGVWRNSVLAASEIAKKVPSQRQYIEIQYEALRNRPQAELGRLLDFLDLKTSDQTVEQIVESNTLERSRQNSGFAAILPASSGPDRKPEPAGFFGAGASGADDFALTSLERFQVERLNGDILIERGYCRSQPRIPLWGLVACSWKVRKLLGLHPA